MKYKTLFRLALKIVAVWLFAASAPRAILQLGYIIYSSLTDGPGAFPMAWTLLTSPIVECACAILLWRGEWLANLAIPSNRPYCPECAYELTAAEGPRCPECGTPFDPRQVSPPLDECGA